MKQRERFRFKKLQERLKKVEKISMKKRRETKNVDRKMIKPTATKMRTIITKKSKPDKK